MHWQGVLWVLLAAAHGCSADEAACQGPSAALPAKGPVGPLQEAQHLHKGICGARVQHSAIRPCHHLPAQAGQR